MQFIVNQKMLDAINAKLATATDDPAPLRKSELVLMAYGLIPEPKKTNRNTNDDHTTT